MLAQFVAILVDFCSYLMLTLSYAGLFVIMAMEAACPLPLLPSTVFLPFAGFLISKGDYAFWPSLVAASLGCLVGALVSYWVAAWGGKRLITRYGRYMLLLPEDLDAAERFFQRYGSPAIFFARLVPGLRIWISYPAGTVRMRLARFCIFTYIGATLWCILLIQAGVQLGSHWQEIGHTLNDWNVPLSVVFGILLLWIVVKRLRRLRRAQ